MSLHEAPNERWRSYSPGPAHGDIPSFVIPSSLPTPIEPRVLVFDVKMPSVHISTLSGRLRRLGVTFQIVHPTPTEATMPSVEVATIGKTASSIVLLVCVMSYITWLITEFYLIYPPISLFVGIAACLFYFLSYVMARQWDRHGRSK